MKLSVVTCTYNSKLYIEKNISSVSMQSYSDYEHIFIDGFSTDGTVEIIEKCKRAYPEKVRFYQVPPAGISNAMNEGIRRASGEYLIHLHSDDSFYDKTVLSDVAEYLNGHPALDWIYGKIRVVDQDGQGVGIFPDRSIFQHRSEKWFGKYLLRYYNYIPHQSVFIRRSVFDRFGNFDETVSSNMDYDLWLRIRNKTQWQFFDRIISNYTIRAGAQSSSLANRNVVRANRETVQRRHINLTSFLIAKLLNRLIGLYSKNKVYK